MSDKRDPKSEKWVGDTSRAIINSSVVTDAIARGLAVIVLVGHPDSGASSIASKPYTNPQEIGMLLLQASQFFMKAGPGDDPSAPAASEAPARCQERESNGVRCELQAGHEGNHACPEALARHRG